MMIRFILQEKSHHERKSNDFDTPYAKVSPDHCTASEFWAKVLRPVLRFAIIPNKPTTSNVKTHIVRKFKCLIIFATFTTNLRTIFFNVVPLTMFDSASFVHPNPLTITIIFTVKKTERWIITTWF